jgi:hypothetical protein
MEVNKITENETHDDTKRLLRNALPNGIHVKTVL